MFVTPHSHYDYLWCDTPDGMGAKNAKLIKEALLLMRTYPGYKYIIDSAMAVEYFKLHHPAMMPELVQRVKEGRIELMGGMVVAPDTLLASGETLARQFLHGMRYFKEHFGVEPKTGFLIDSFSITAQFPQVLVKAGLEQFIFVRGAVRRTLPQEFHWKALDGTSILTHWMRINYSYVLPPYTGTILPPLYPFAPIPFTIAFIPQAFKVHEILKTVFPPIKYLFQRIACIDAGAALIGSDIGGLKFTIKRRAAQAATSNVFILCGTDNLPPSSNVLDAVDYLDRKSKRYRARVALPRDFFQAIRGSGRDLRSIGPCEMSGFMDKFTGTFSGRIRVKQALRSCEHALYTAEVASVVASARSGFPYPAGEIKKATWRLLRCCFHDALPGCCIDAAFEHVIKQLKLSTMQLDRICKSALISLASSVDTSGLPEGAMRFLVFNAVAATRDGTATVAVPGDASGITIVNAKGDLVPFQRDRLSTDEHAHVIACTAVPPAGYTTYTVIRANGQDRQPKPDKLSTENNVSTQGNTVEVKGTHFTLVFESGRLHSIKDKAGAVLVAGKQQAINELRIFNDRGDSYLAGTMPKKVFTTFGNKLDIIEDGPVRVVIRISSKLRCKNKWFFKPFNGVVQYVILYNHDTPRIDFITHIENRTRNVRIQACFPVPVEQPTFRTEVPFGHVERDPTTQKGNSWGEKNKRFAHYDRIFPAINWMDVSSAQERKGMTIVNNGLPEQEISKDKGTVFLTLLRSTGYIGTLGLAHVPLLLGPFYSIPEAYEIGSHEFRYSLILHDGNHVAASIATQALGCNVPLVTTGVNDARKGAGTLLPPKDFIKVEPGSFVVTAIKQSEDEPREIVVRVLETSNALAAGRISFGHPLREVRLLDLVERPLSTVVVDGGTSFSFSSKPQEILTFGITLDVKKKSTK